MKITKYYCDCCGREVENENKLQNIKVFNDMLFLQGEKYYHDIKEIYNVCSYTNEAIISEKVNEIQKEARNNEN